MERDEKEKDDGNKKAVKGGEEEEGRERRGIEKEKKMGHLKDNNKKR